jgi:hypothetical protein
MVHSAGAGFDILVGAPGNDYLDGGIDTDQSIYDGVWSNYKIVTYAGTTAVSSNPAFSNEGIDKIVDVEGIIFADRTVNRAADTFSPLDYIASYADLRAVFGVNDATGASHFIANGANEGGRITFDGLDYIASYGDLIAAFRGQIAANPNDDIGATHFISAGASEGRAVTFDPVAYELANPDIAAAFGANLEAATAHYITQGFFEGRLIA